MEIKEAAHKLGKSYQYVRQLEEGINSPPAWPLLSEFAALYATSADYLLGLTADPAPAQSRDLPQLGAEMLEVLRGLSPAGGEEVLAVARILAQHERRRQEDLAAWHTFVDYIEAMRGMEFAAALQETLNAAHAGHRPGRPTRPGRDARRQRLDSPPAALRGGR